MTRSAPLDQPAHSCTFYRRVVGAPLVGSAAVGKHGVSRSGGCPAGGPSAGPGSWRWCEMLSGGAAFDAQEGGFAVDVAPDLCCGAVRVFGSEGRAESVRVGVAGVIGGEGRRLP